MKLTKLLLSGLVFTFFLSLFGCDDCSKIDCENGGTCNDNACNCLKGYEGERCETKDFCVLNEVECVFGTCEEGICNCDDGYERIDCSRQSREKFIGVYLMDEVCDTNIYKDQVLDVTYDEGDVTKFKISGLYEDFFFSKVWARANPNTVTFTIPRQSPDGNAFDISGNGSIVKGDSIDTITVDYTIFFTNQGDKKRECTAIGIGK